MQGSGVQPPDAKSTLLFSGINLTVFYCNNSYLAK